MATTNYGYLAQFAPGIYAPALDVTGALPANKVTSEVHTVTGVNALDYHFIVPLFAPFFKDGLQLQFTPSGGSTRNLVEGVDYQVAFEFIGASRGTAKPVYGGIIFLDNTLTGQVRLAQYQTLGGNWVLNLTAIQEVLANRQYNPRVISWEQVTNYPSLFPPSPHEWNLTDLVGMSDVVDAITALGAAIAARPVSVVPAGYTTHVNRTDNPHGTTKAQVGLGNVDNYATATSAQAVAGTATNLFVTPAGVSAAIASALTSANLNYQAHVNDLANPHQTTAAQVGLGAVGNYPVATQAEAVAHAANDRYMTPLRTWDAVVAGIGSGQNAVVGTLGVNFDAAFSRAVYLKSGVVPTVGAAAAGGLTFLESTGGAASDTGIYSSADGMMQLYSNGEMYLALDGGQGILQTGKIIQSTNLSLQMANTSTGRGGLALLAQGQGDSNLAGMSFMNQYYSIKMGVRHDGYFGIGGWNRSNWSWYSSPDGNMTAAGDVVAYSDPRLKENIEPIESASQKLSYLQGCYFTWKHGIEHVATKAGRRDMGVLADQVKAIFPEIVYSSISLDGVAYDTVAYEKLVPALIAAHNEHSQTIQSLNEASLKQAKLIEALEKRLAILEKQNDPL